MKDIAQCTGPHLPSGPCGRKGKKRREEFSDLMERHLEPSQVGVLCSRKRALANVLGWCTGSWCGPLGLAPAPGPEAASHFTV